MGKVLKSVLKQFLDHYHELENSQNLTTIARKESAENGYATPPPLSMYDKEFLKLKELTESLKNDPICCPVVEGQSDVNKKKNRYKDILPCKFSHWIVYFCFELSSFVFQMTKVE